MQKPTNKTIANNNKIVEDAAYYNIKREYNPINKVYENIATFYTVDGEVVGMITVDIKTKNNKRIRKIDKMLDYKCTNMIKPNKIILTKVSNKKYVLVQDKNKIVVFRCQYDKEFNKETFINYQLNECEKPIDMDYVYLAKENISFVDKSNIQTKKSTKRKNYRKKQSNGFCTIS